MNKYSNKPNGVIIAVVGWLRSRQGFGDNPWQDQFWKKHCSHASYWKDLACLAKGSCPASSPNWDGNNHHRADTIFLFWEPCAKEKPMAIEGRIMPADSNLFDSALAISSFSESRQQDFAKTRGWLLVWLWCSTPWVGVGFTSPFLKIEGNF